MRYNEREVMGVIEMVVALLLQSMSALLSIVPEAMQMSI